jgi:hypothetical protein
MSSARWPCAAAAALSKRRRGTRERGDDSCRRDKRFHGHGTGDIRNHLANLRGDFQADLLISPCFLTPVALNW